MTDGSSGSDFNQNDAGFEFDPFNEGDVSNSADHADINAAVTSGEEARVSRLSAANPADFDHSDDVVSEYEQRYRPSRVEGEKPKRHSGSTPLRFPSDAVKGKRPFVPMSYSTMNVSHDERLWASVAHASIWLTLIGGFISIGMVSVVSLFIPLVIYFAFRQKSDFVAFHALQAFVLQLFATVGVTALLVVGGILWGLGLAIAALSLLVLVGVVLLPLWLIIGVAFFVVGAALPFAAGVFGAIAAVEVYNGRDYQYPYIARMIDRQLSHSYVRAA